MRIHVVGASGATEAELRTALDSIEGGGSARFRIGSSGPWIWANASVWHVNGSDIDQALASLTVPALRVTSSDGVLWMLTLMSPGKPLFRGVHHFTAVGDLAEEPPPEDHEDDEEFPRDELVEVAGINRYIPALEFLWDAEEEARIRAEMVAEEAATVPGLDGYADYGVSLPSVVIEAMKREPHRAERIAFLAHGSQIVDALEEYGFEINRTTLLELLTVGPLTELEQDSDLGNMPRFLRALGIDGVFQEEADEEDADDEDAEEAIDDEDFEPADPVWADHPAGGLFEKFESVLPGHSLTEISGGPVIVAHAGVLHLLSHLLSEDPATSVLIEFPSEDAVPEPAWRELNALEVRQKGCRWQFCFETAHWWFGGVEPDEFESHALTRSFQALPDGTQFKIAFLVPALAEQCHRYAGTCRGGTFGLDQAYPVVAADLLKEALALAGQVVGSRPIELISEEETRAVRDSYQRSQEEPLKVRNGKAKPDDDGRDDVIQTLLFQRFENRGPWDIAAARARVEAEWREFEELCHPSPPEEAETSEEREESSAEIAAMNALMQTMQAAAEKAQQAKVVPHSEEVIYEGRTGKFLRASMADLSHLSQPLLDEHNAALESLGFHALGDVVADVDQRQEITRCYAGNPQAVSLLSHRNANNQLGWAPIAHGAVSVDFSHGTREFHTFLDDGSVFVTTSIDATKSKPEARIYVRCYEDIPLTQLWEKHLDGIRRFQTHCGAVPIDHTKLATVAQFLARMDDLFCRFMGQS